MRSPDASAATGHLSVLFVADAPDEFHGVARRLHRLRPHWKLWFADTAAGALELVESSPVDVVLCDRRVGERDGIGLLREIRRRRPSTVRVILSNEADRRAIFRSTRVAHQAIPKPCNVERVRHTIDRIEQSRSALDAETIDAVVASADQLPTPGPVHEQLTVELDGACSLPELERIVSSDIAITADLLRIVNSAFFGLVRQIERIRDAIAFVGIDVLSAVVAARSIFRPDDRSAVDVEAVNRHSRAVAALAALAHGESERSSYRATQAFAAGLLHDVGVLVLGNTHPDDLDRATTAAVLDEHDPLYDRLHFGADRYSVGRAMLGLWSFDEDIADAVAQLGEPAATVDRTGLAWTLRIAHEAIVSGRISETDALEGDPIELKLALADIVDELETTGAVARSDHLVG